MFVYPVNREAALPEAFLKYAIQADKPASLDPALVAQNREKWIADWTAAIVH
jgi:thiamine transport system substrate-binding protein